MKKYKKDLLFPISLFFVLMIFSSLLYYFEIPNKSVSSLDRSNLSATVYNTLSNINGNSFIYSTDRSIQVVTSDYLAGAVSALIWNGKQYINDIGHGASLQYVVSVNGLGENYNPTEAGGRHDDYNLRQLDDVRTSDLALQNNTMIAPPWAPYSQPVLTSSILEQFSAGAQTASSRSRMAFWNTKSSLRSTWTDVNGIHYYPPAINTSTT